MRLFRRVLPSSRLAVFTRLASRPIPRVTRMMSVAQDLGYDTLFLAARRDEGLADTESYSGQTVQRIGPYFPLLNGRLALLYLRSVICYNFALVRELMARKPGLVHCSDIETMPAGVLYKWLSSARLIYNIHDNLAQRYNVPTWAQAVLSVVEGVAVRLSSTTLVPESFRRDTLPRWCRAKIAVVRNTPADPGVFPPGEIDGPIRLFFGGWLDEGRGLRYLMELAARNPDIEVTFAGEGSPELIAEILATPRARYLGFVTHEEILAETARAHVVAAIYDPVRPINRYAASNKLAEALACGRPALVNSEMLITRMLADHDCLLMLPYADLSTDAAPLLRSLKNEGGAVYRAKCAASRGAYEAHYTWAEAEAGMIRALEGR